MEATFSKEISPFSSLSCPLNAVKSFLKDRGSSSSTVFSGEDYRSYRVSALGGSSAFSSGFVGI